MVKSKTDLSALSSREEKALLKILTDPVRWGETFLLNRDGSQRQFWEHQKEDLRCKSKNIIHQDGRDVGKSVCIVTDLLHYAFTTKGGSGLVATPHQGHLDTLIDEFEFQVGENPDLTTAIAINKSGHSAITRKPYFKAHFISGTVIHFRPGGDYGKAFRSLHVDRVWIDEAAWLPEQAWRAVRQCLNAGGRFRLYSNPNGLRDTTYYRITKEKKRWKLFHWPSSHNPNWTEDREQELLDFYGGRDTPGFQHEVLGEHGRPSYGAFNHEQFKLCQKVYDGYRAVSISGEELSDCDSEDEVRDRLDLLMCLAPEDGLFWVGADTGYTNDPSEVTVWKEDEIGTMRLVFRLHTAQVHYPALAEVIAIIDRYYNPRGIGIDNGGNGLSVVQDLKNLDKFRGQDFENKVRGFDFGGATVIGYDDDTKPVRKRTKEYMTALINRALAKRKAIFPIDDIDIENEFTTHTYTLQNGRVVYSKGNDHIVDSTRCAFLRREVEKLDGLDPHYEEVYVAPMATNAIF